MKGHKNNTNMDSYGFMIISHMYMRDNLKRGSKREGRIGLNRKHRRALGQGGCAERSITAVGGGAQADCSRYS